MLGSTPVFGNDGMRSRAGPKFAIHYPAGTLAGYSLQTAALARATMRGSGPHAQPVQPIPPEDAE